MDLKNYLKDTFLFNDQANKRLLSKTKLLPDPSGCLKLFSHLINCQFKWMARLQHEDGYETLSWWEPVYATSDLEAKWNRSLQIWLDYLDATGEDVLTSEVTFSGLDEKIYAATPKDIALQLNYHSIHHRAQMQVLIRQQGVEPDFLDYIGTKYRQIS